MVSCMNEWQRMMRRMKNELRNWWQARKSRPAKRPDIKMCPVCGKFNPSKANVCEYCEAGLNPKPQGDVDAFGGPRTDPLNPVVLLFFLCVGMYAISIFLSSRVPDYNPMKEWFSPNGLVLTLMGKNDPNDGYRIENFIRQSKPGAPQLAPAGREFWRIATYIFLHGGMLHIFMNLGGLAYIGAIVLDKYGARRFWLITFFTGICGGALSALGTLMLGGGAVGFSGALVGDLGAGYIHFRATGITFFRDMFQKFLVWGNGLCILLTLLGIMKIDNLGHIGGMIGGLALGQIFEKRSRWWKPIHEHLLLAACLLLWGYGLYRVFIYVDYFFIKGYLY